MSIKDIVIQKQLNQLYQKYSSLPSNSFILRRIVLWQIKTLEKQKKDI